MDDSERRRIAEALILASPEPISPQRVAAVIPYCKPAKVKVFVEQLNIEYAEQNRTFEICEIAGGYQMRTLPEFAVYVQQIKRERPLRLSRAALETLAIVAYRQPVARAEIENIRGVDSGPVVRSLLERKLLRIAGHRDAPGRPLLYATTRRFLEVFSLEGLDGLPSLRQVEELEIGREFEAAASAEGAREAPLGAAPAVDRADPVESPH